MVIFMPIVLGPFPHITVHVAQSEGIGFFFSHRVILTSRVPSIPSDSIQILFGIAGEKTGDGSGSAGVFPFRLTGESQIRPVGVGFGVAPTHADHRLIGSVVFGVGPEFRFGGLRIVFQI